MESIRRGSRTSIFTGPVAKRQCTDTYYGLVFVLCVFGLILLAIGSYALGDYRRISFPRDTNDHICGVDHPSRPFLIFFDSEKCQKQGTIISAYTCNTIKVCVSKCPDYDWKFNGTSDNDDDRDLMICLGGKSANAKEYKFMSVQKLINDSLCAPQLHKSFEVFSRCLPRNRTDKNTNTKKISQQNLNLAFFDRATLEVKSLLTNGLSDMERNKRSVIFFLILACTLSILWLVLVRLCAGVVICLTLLSFDVFFMTASIHCFWQYRTIHTSTTEPETFEFSWDISYYLQYEISWMILGILSFALFFVVAFLIVFLRSRIRLAVLIIKETCHAVKAIPTILLWPMVPVVLYGCLLVFGFWVDVNLRSMDTEIGRKGRNVSDIPNDMSTQEWVRWTVQNSVECKPSKNATLMTICRLIEHGGSKNIAFLELYNFLICVWIWNFVTALKELTLAGTFVTYYFSRPDPKNLMPRNPLFRSFCTALFCNFGSLAMGSMLLASIGLVQSIMVIIQKKIRASEHNLAKIINQLCCPCCRLVDFFFRFMNKHAYVMIAIYGFKFSVASRAAFEIILLNIVRMLTIDQVVGLVMRIGKYVICGAIGVVALCYYDGTISKLSGGFILEIEPKLYSTTLVVTTIVACTYFMADTFFSAYDMGTDAVFLCFCVDLQRNDGSATRPYFMTGDLMKLCGDPEWKSKRLSSSFW